MAARSKARRAADAALAKLYASLPRMDCKGLCSDSCGTITMSELEEIRLGEAVGGTLPGYMPDGGGPIQCVSCPILKDGRCSAYDRRPLICRLWGMVDHEFMRCPHGCRPSRYLSHREGDALLRRAEEISVRYKRERP